MIFINIVVWEIPHNNADWDCFRTLTLPGILRTQNRLQVNFVHIFKSYVRANKLDVQETDLVSHSSTESEIISLGARIRMDGTPALISVI